MNKEQFAQYLVDHNYPTYERSKYDSFLKNEKIEFKFPSIHITGTNGKGSTANYLYQIYLKAGYKVGLYTSPYLDDVTEMVSINGKQIDFETYIERFNSLQSKFEKYNLSSFEMETIVAFTLFEDAKLDIVIVEVGMGGYIDATNIITPMLSIITSVSLEHTSYLGGTTSEIAANKAGIIKRYVPVLLGKLDEFAMYAIRETAKKNQSDVYVVCDYFNEKIVDGKIRFDCQSLKDVELNIPVLYQIKNACLAIDAVKFLSDKIGVSDDIIKEGLKSATLPCRYEMVDNNVLVDGAHNPEAMQALVDSLKLANEKPVHVIFASFRDKNFSHMLNILDTVSQDITITTFNHKRAKTEDEYFLFLATYAFDKDYLGKIKSLKEQYPDDLILVTGSLYFAGLVKRELRK